MTRTEPDSMIEVRGLMKRYGTTAAVDGLTFTVAPGRVTGFLGPNGAGKTTTMRCILGLDRPTAGSATIGGKKPRELAQPMREVGALLDPKAVHGGRTAYHHLLCLARAGGVPVRRVDEVLELTGLGSVARKRPKGFSLGMSQRLGIASALLGDPKAVLFDEPANGLDPEGILWIRGLMKNLAADGRTVLVSSHLMSEMENTADHLIVIGRGRVLADSTMNAFITRAGGGGVRVLTPDPDGLMQAVITAGAAYTADRDGRLTVTGLDPAQISDLAAVNGIRLYEVTAQRASLEEAFLRLTRDSVEYRSNGKDRA